MEFYRKSYYVTDICAELHLKKVNLKVLNNWFYKYTDKNVLVWIIIAIELAIFI